MEEDKDGFGMSEGLGGAPAPEGWGSAPAPEGWNDGGPESHAGWGPEIKKPGPRIHPYYYVGPCPRCGSYMTGRYVKDHRTNDIRWVVESALRHGELVRPVAELPPHSDAFCMSCGNSWYDGVRMIWISRTDMEAEKRRRGTAAILEDMYAEEREEDMNDRRPLKGLRRFIGKI